MGLDFADIAVAIARTGKGNAMAGQRRLSIASHRVAPLFRQGQLGQNLPHEGAEEDVMGALRTKLGTAVVISSVRIV